MEISNEQFVKVKSIHKRFHGNFINENEHTKERVITIPGFTRLGFELNGIFLNKNLLSSICWGEQESKFLNKLNEQQQQNVIHEILKKNPPLFLLSKNFLHTELLKKLNETLNENRSAIIQLELTTVEIYSLIGTWISKSLSRWKTIHGTVLNILGEGVLIIGKPGVGKSESATELLRMNHLFLADDAVNVARFGTLILAKPNETTKDLLHIRGLGLMNIKAMYGEARIIEETNINVVIELIRLKTEDKFGDTFENIGDKVEYYNLLGVSIPIYRLPVTSGRNVSELIELSVIDMKLKRSGYNSASIFQKQYIEKIQKN